MSSNNFSITPLNLGSGDYFIRTSDTQNPYLGIRGLDDIVGYGVYSFIINGSEFLQRGSEIRIEAIDSNGNQILISGVKNLLKGTSRVVTFTIDEEITGSTAKLFISATLSQFVENGVTQVIPNEFSGIENFLFEYNFQIDKNRINSDEIIFRKNPAVTITPLIKTVRRITKSTSTTSNITATVKSYEYNPSTSEYTLEVSTDFDAFTIDMNGGNVEIVGKEVPVYGSIDLVSPIPKRNAIITLSNPDLEIYTKDKFKGLIQSPIQFTITYTTITSFGDGILQQQAYADMFIQDMEVVSGDVQKIKVFTKSDTLDTDYSLNSEHDVVFKNLLEIDGVGSIGLFNSSGKLDYWNITKIDAGAANPSISTDDTIFLSAVTITGDYDNPNTTLVRERTLQTPRYELKSNIGLTLKKNTNYKLTLNAAVTDVPTTEDTRLDVYISGSNLPVGCSNNFGTLIHSFRTNSDRIWNNEFDIIYNRENDITDGELVFVTTAGKWYLQDIQLSSEIKEGFSPSEFRVQFPVEVLKPNQDVDFKIQFYDGNDNKADFVLYKDNIIFDRPNLVVEGNQNVLTGSLYVGSNSGSGVEIGSSGGGGLVRSIGYEGFISGSAGIGSGFLMFSGSVLPDNPDNYQGVGLELFDTTESYLRFRTNPSVLDVRTSTFFLGSSDQFISGSDGNIEISSSRFHLDPTNNILIVSGTVQAADGNIGDFQIVDGKISGSNITLDANNSFIFKTDQGPGTDIQAPGFESQADEYYIDFTPSGSVTGTLFYIKMGPNFMIDKNGILIASGAVFEGTITASEGLIGGFVIGSSSLFSQTGNVSISGSPTPTGFFISASNFNVKGNGNVTASAILLTNPTATAGTFTNGTFDNPNLIYIGAGNFNNQDTGFYVNSNASMSLKDTFVWDSENLTISGSSVSIDVQDFVATGNSVEISGSNFHLLNGNITASNARLSGNITATTGNIGGFAITPNAITGSSFYLSGSATGNGFFISASNFNVKANGQLTASSAQITGKITSTEGTIGGWTIGSTTLTGGTTTLTSTGNITVGTSNNVARLSSNDATYRLWVGNATAGSAPFRVTQAGAVTATSATITGNITATSGQIGGFNISSDAISGTGFYLSGSSTGNNFFISSSKFNVKANGDVTGSAVLFTGGKISGSNLTIDVQNFVAKGNSVEISGSNFHLLNGNVTASNARLSGNITATTGNIGGFAITPNAITGSQFYLSGSATGNGFFISSSKFNVKASGDITGSQVLFTGGKIGGFTITDSLISSSNLEINSNGTLRTSDFADGLKGWIISSQGNGSAQFENVKIRGTLRTTVFEKETVNAVGGQLWVANSTVLSQSVTNSETTMSVENVTGFEQNEILLIKKVDELGFNSEYVLVNSSSRNVPASSTNFSGKLYVQRAYGNGLPTGSEDVWITELASSAQDYTEGQVIVSTGKQDTGWILLNASPNNSYTPYIDIVERTGSGIYDTELKVRLGDLSGLSQTRLLGVDPNTAGFGLYSENVFLEGGIRASFGEIGGFGITSNAISSSNNNLILRSNGQITGSNFLFGDISRTDNYIQYNGGDLVIKGTINITGGDAATQTFVNTATSSLSSSINTTINNVSSSIDNTITNVSSSIDNTITNVSSSINSNITNISSSINTNITNVSSSTAARIVTDAANKIIKPNDAPAGGAGLYLTSKYLGYYDNSDWNAYISSSGEFLFKADDDNQISFGNNSFILKVSDEATLSGSSINLITPQFFFGGNSQFISGSSGNIEISSSNFHLQPDGDVIVNGTINITGGNAATTSYVNSATSSLSSSINNTITNVSSSTASTITNVSSSIDNTITNVSSSTASTITNLSSSAASGIASNASNITTVSSSTAARIVTDAANKIIKPNDAPAGGAGLYLTSKYLGYYNASAWNAYISSSGEFLFKEDDNNLISFGNNSFILKVSDQATLSGSAINLLTPRFFFGGNSQFISGSNGNIEISSSNFHLQPDGDVIVNGTINIVGGNAATQAFVNTATSSLSSSVNNTITGVSSSVNNTITNVSSSAASGISSLDGRIDDYETQVVLDSDGMSLRKLDGTVLADYGTSLTFYDGVDDLAANVKVTVGSTGFRAYGDNTTTYTQVNSSGLTIVDNSTTVGSFTSNGVTVGNTSAEHVSISTSGVDLKDSTTTYARFASTTTIGSASTEHVEITSTGLKLKDGTTERLVMDTNGIRIGTEVTISAAGAATFGGTLSAPDGNIGGFTLGASQLYTGTKSTFASTAAGVYVGTDGIALGTNSPFKVTAAGQLTASAAQITGNITAQTGTIGGFNIGTNLQNSAGSTLILKGSTGQLTASAAQITGNITAQTGTIGGFNIGTNLQNSAGSTLILKGASGQLTASAAQITGNITAQTGTIGGFNIGTNLENSAGSTLILKGSSGQLTASAAQITGKITSTEGTLGGWTITPTTLTGGDTTLTNSGNITVGTGDDVARLSSSDSTYRLWIGDSTANDAPFKVTKEGAVTATDITATGTGNIAGWTVNSDKLTRSTVASGPFGLPASYTATLGSEGLTYGLTNLFVTEKGIYEANRWSYQRTNSFLSADEAVYIEMVANNISSSINFVHTDDDGATNTLIGRFGKGVNGGSTVEVRFETPMTIANSLLAGGVTSTTLSLTSLPNLTTEATALVINGSNNVGYRELGTLAFSSATYDNYGSWTLAGTSGTPQTISSGNTATIAAGTAITTTAGATDTVTIAHSDTSALNGLYGTNGITSITVDSLGHVTAISTATYDNYGSWTMSDGSTTQTVSSGNTVTFAAGTGLDVAVSATDTVTYSLDLTEITLNAGLDATATGLSLDLTEVGFGAGANRVITNDGDGTVTAEANFTFDGNTITLTGGHIILDRTSGTNISLFQGTDENGDGLFFGVGGTGYPYFAPVATDSINFSREFFWDGLNDRWAFDDDLYVGGTLSKAAGSFSIPHPLPHLSSSIDLVHSFIEGPRADLIYRGKVDLVDGNAQINIDIESGMTEGTFEVLCTNVQCFTSNETGWDNVRGKVIGNILHIESQNTSSVDTISWMVVGERNDDTIKRLSLTDDEGKLMVEVPAKIRSHTNGSL